jgi:hypothetical protein
MFVLGPNGFATVIGSLVGLHTAAPVEDWAEALRNVWWTIGEVLKARKVHG